MSAPLRPVAAEAKQCCAQWYGSSAARALFGESFHPGGLALTLDLAARLRLAPHAVVLDAASGPGTSALAIAERYGCTVVGVDLSAANVDAANAAAAARGLTERARFVLGDAEALPFPDAAFDALLCECAFCTFPDKARAAAEFARVLRPGGHLGLSDLTRSGAEAPELDGLLAWVACIGDAQPLERYAAWLGDASLVVRESFRCDGALQQMIDAVRGRLFAAELLTRLERSALPPIDLEEAKQLAGAAQRAIRNGLLGYGVLVAERVVG